VKQQTHPFFTVGVASSLVGVSPPTLRRWERHGLLAPVREGRARRRLYTWRDIERAQQIRYLVVRKRVPLRDVKMRLPLAPAPHVPLVPAGSDGRGGAPLVPRLALAIPR